MSFADRLRGVLRRIKGTPGAETPVAEGAGEAPEAPDELTDADLAVLATLPRCTACRACDIAFDGYERAARPVFRGPSELVLTYGKSPSDHGAARKYLESLERGDLHALERVCPVGIPFVALSDLVSRRTQALSQDEKKPVPESRTRHDPG